MRGSGPRIAVWALAHAGLLAALTWPLLARLRDHLVGPPGDNWIFAWNLWWFQQALFVDHVDPFYTHALFHPHGVSLAYHTTTLLNTLPGAAAVRAGMPLPVVFNALVFANFVLAAWATHALVVRVWGSRATAGDAAAANVQVDASSGSWRLHVVGLFAGLAYAMAPFHLAHLGHLNVFTVWPLPVLALALHAYTRVPTWRGAAAVGGAAGACGLADPQYLLAAVLWIGVWGAAARLPHAWRHARHAVMAAAAAALVAAPVWVPMLRYGARGLAEVQAGGNNVFVADLLAYVVPSPLHPLWGDAVRPLYARFTGNLAESVVFPGFVVWALVIWGWRRTSGWRPVRAWVVATVVFVVLSLGPYLHVLGQSAVHVPGAGTAELVRLPLPKLLLDQIPGLAGARAAGRFAALAQLGLVVLASGALLRVRRPRIVLGLLAGLLAESWVAPLTTTPVEVPPLYTRLAREVARTGQRGALLEIPPVHPRDKRQQYMQSVHGLPILGGRVARGPRTSYDRLYADAFIGRLADPEPLARRDGLLALDGLDSLGVQWILVHGADEPRAGAVVELLSRRWDTWATDSGDYLLRPRSRAQRRDARSRSGPRGATAR